MDRISIFLKTKIGKIVVAIIIILIFIGLSFLLLIIPKTNNFTPEETEVPNPSGQIVYETNYEPEGEQGLLIIGLQFMYDFGFSEPQQEKLYSSIKDFFTEKYPDVKMVSYVEGSFNYPEPSNTAFTRFNMEADNGLSFLVTLDTEYNYNTLIVKIREL